MRRICIAVMFLLTVFRPASAGNAASADSLWNGAVASYSAEDYTAALNGFLALEGMGIRTPDLYYNIGNSYYKCGRQVAKAVLYYERALKADPSFGDATHNLTLARAFVTDRIDVVPEFVMFTWLKSVRNRLSSDTWAILCLLLLALALASVFFVRFGRRVSSRKLCFVTAIFFFVASAFALGCSLSGKHELERKDRAVVMVPVSSAKSSPNTGGQSLFIIHEGTDVRILEELGEWSRIELTDGRQGWITSKDVEVI